MSSWPFTSPPPASSVPDFEEAVPGTSGHRHPISCDPQAADPVVMAREDAWGKGRGVRLSPCADLAGSVCTHRNPRLGRLGSDFSPPDGDWKVERGLALKDGVSLEANLSVKNLGGGGAERDGERLEVSVCYEKSKGHLDGHWKMGKVTLLCCFFVSK